VAVGAGTGAGTGCGMGTGLGTGCGTGTGFGAIGGVTGAVGEGATGPMSVGTMSGKTRPFLHLESQSTAAQGSSEWFPQLKVTTSVEHNIKQLHANLLKKSAGSWIWALQNTGEETSMVITFPSSRTTLVSSAFTKPAPFIKVKAESVDTKARCTKEIFFIIVLVHGGSSQCFVVGLNSSELNLSNTLYLQGNRRICNYFAFELIQEVSLFCSLLIYCLLATIFLLQSI